MKHSLPATQVLERLREQPDTVGTNQVITTTAFTTRITCTPPAAANHDAILVTQQQQHEPNVLDVYLVYNAHAWCAQGMVCHSWCVTALCTPPPPLQRIQHSHWMG